jgi:hypothetical protein
MAKWQGQVDKERDFRFVKPPLSFSEYCATQSTMDEQSSLTQFPMLLTFKRRGTRIMPSGQVIAEYRSDQLGVTIFYPSLVQDRT